MVFDARQSYAKMCADVHFSHIKSANPHNLFSGVDGVRVWNTVVCVFGTQIGYD